MFGLFESKKNHFIGLDFGTSGIKMVELSYDNQQAKLENYGWVDLSGLFSDNQSRPISGQSYEEKVRAYLAALVKKMGLEKRSVFVSVPGFSGLITLIELPQMKQEEMENAIQFEVYKYIPSSLEEIAISWEVVGRDSSGVFSTAAGENKEKKVQILLVAAPKKDVARYEGFVRGSGLSVGAIELETFSISRSLVGDDQGIFLVIDIGAMVTNIILIEKGTIRINRNIDAGGNEVTKTIAENMSVSLQRAEMFKRGEKDLINGKEASLIIPVLELIAGEALRMINSYKEKNPNARIDSILLSGGAAKMKGIDQYFANALGVRTARSNPWRKVVVPNELLGTVEKMGSSFSVAVGLALRGMEEYKRK